MIPIYHRRRFVNRFNMTFSVLVTALGILFLAWILGTLLYYGVAGVSLALFTENTPAPGNQGGLLNAIFGSALLTLLGIGMGAPVGILAGTFLAEYANTSKFTRRVADATRFINDILLSAPSILIGLFVYVICVVPTHHFSAWAGAISLALIALPVVVRTSEDMLHLVPNDLREAATALGAPRWKVVVRVSYRAARAGILTGVLLAVARIAGETAPLLFTALNNQFWSSDVNAPMANLPVVIFQFALSPYADWQSLAWAGALLVTASILGLNIFVRMTLGKKQRG
ncbi:MAG TPA: phosphate ABC transporter permease PstA [Alphaproteobacteria bacterium]|nr:phosphate ABC transporter permease PstA [Alphaproteobacteria bacterium]